MHALGCIWGRGGGLSGCFFSHGQETKQFFLHFWFKADKVISLRQLEAIPCLCVHISLSCSSGP